MNKRDIIMLAIGAVVGGGVVAVADYIRMRRKQKPVEDLAKEVETLEASRQSKCRQLDMIDKEFADRKTQYESVLQELEDRLDEYEAEEAEHLAKVASRDITEDEPVDEVEDEVVEDDAKHIKELNMGYVINDGNPRWDGPLNDDEQAMYDACEGDADMEYATLIEIKEHRFDETTDPDRMRYLISEHEHEIAPEFIDDESLDYYEADDILARGRSIVQNVEDLINPNVLLHFGEGTSDPSVVWCRNDEYKTDYEIVKHPGSYQSAVYGIDEDSAYIPEHKYNRERAIELEESAHAS